MRNGWEYKKLGDCFPYIKNGANIKQVKGAQGYPITRIETLSGGVFNRDRMGYADIYDLSKYKDYIMSDSDLLMSHINSKTYIGRTVEYKAIGEEIIIHGMNLLRLKSNVNVINSTFFAYYTNSGKFKSAVARIRKDAVNQSSMAISDIKKIEIPVPPKSTQLAIVSELDKINELIRLKKEQLVEYDNLAQSIFYEMFGDPVENEKGWEVKKLGEIGVLGRGVSKHRPRNAPELLGGTMPLIQTGDVANADFYIRKYVSTYSELGIAQSKIWMPGTLCITIAATIGKCAILSFPACFPDSVVGFTPNERADTIYMYYIFSNMQKMLEEFAPGVAQKNINLKILNDLNIPIPPLPLQQSFASRIEQIEKLKSEVQNAITDLETLLASRMQYWFE